MMEKMVAWLVIMVILMMWMTFMRIKNPYQGCYLLRAYISLNKSEIYLKYLNAIKNSVKWHWSNTSSKSLVQKVSPRAYKTQNVLKMGLPV